MAPFESRTTRIDTTPEDLFEYITAVDTIADWYDEWDEVTHDGRGKALEVGAGFRLTSEREARSATCRVVEAAAPNSLSWNEYGLEGTTVRVSFDLEPAGEGATLLTLSKRLIAAI